MRIGNRLFAPKLWASLLYLAVFCCMLLLGNWQLNRAALKVTMQKAAENAMLADAVPLEQLEDLTSAAASYTRVSVTGTYDPDRQFLWDNRTHQGQAGFEVISTIQLADGSLALVNRGWIAPGPDRQNLPDISFEPTALQDPVIMEGYLSMPSKGFASGKAITGGTGWPRLLQFFDYEAIANELEQPVIGALIQTQALATDASGASALSSRPEWLEANWQPAASGPAKHYSYAFQWFAMAFALTVIFLVVNTSRIHAQA